MLGYVHQEGCWAMYTRRVGGRHATLGGGRREACYLGGERRPIHQGESSILYTPPGYIHHYTLLGTPAHPPLSGPTGVQLLLSRGESDRPLAQGGDSPWVEEKTLRQKVMKRAVLTVLFIRCFKCKTVISVTFRHILQKVKNCQELSSSSRLGGQEAPFCH